MSQQTEREDKEPLSPLEDITGSLETLASFIKATKRPYLLLEVLRNSASDATKDRDFGMAMKVLCIYDIILQELLFSSFGDLPKELQKAAKRIRSGEVPKTFQ